MRQAVSYSPPPMRTYTLFAPAKINLHLEILGDRPDGYHELAMVMQSVSLADQIQVRANGTEMIRVHCDHPQVPTDSSNLAYKAAALMAQQFPDVFARYGGVEIDIHKRIPVGAGLAGGSTNAAAVLVGIDLLWSLGLTQSEIQELGEKLGSDVPFCVSGGTAIATGRGEKLSPLPDLNTLFVVLAKYRSLSVSTPWAYKTYREQFKTSYVVDVTSLEGRRQRVHSGPIVSAIGQKDGGAIGKLLYNDLEKVVLPAHPQVSALRDAMKRFSSLGAMMSGSGPTVFALAASAAEAEQIHSNVREQFPDPDLELWTAQLVAGGIQFVKE